MATDGRIHLESISHPTPIHQRTVMRLLNFIKISIFISGELDLVQPRQINIKDKYMD